MNNSTLRVEFNRSNFKELEEAKSIYRQARLEGRSISNPEGVLIDRFKDCYDGFIILEKELKESELSVRIFDESGDRRLIWNLTDPDQVSEAGKIFNEYLSKGWKAYSVKLDGTLGYRISEFDASKCEIVFDDRPTSQKLSKFVQSIPKSITPTSNREKLDSFLKKFNKVHLLPRTYPG